MKVAIDIHGTIDARPEFFSKFTKLLKAFGVEIHVTTGVPISARVKDQLDAWEIEYDVLFSITDYHESIGTPIRWDENGDPWIADLDWNSTKGAYCRQNNIDLAIDNSAIYQRYFTTSFLLFEKEDMNRIKMVGDDGLPFADWLVP